MILCRYFVLVNAIASAYTLILLFIPTKNSCGHMILVLDLVRMISSEKKRWDICSYIDDNYLKLITNNYVNNLRYRCQHKDIVYQQNVVGILMSYVDMLT